MMPQQKALILFLCTVFHGVRLIKQKEYTNEDKEHDLPLVQQGRA